MTTYKCRLCFQLTTRDLTIRKNKRIRVDERGRRWIGFKCPDCVMKHIIEARKKAKEEDKEEDTLYKPDNTTRRLCKVCEKALPASKYFKHNECSKEIDYWDMEETYAFRF